MAIGDGETGDSDIGREIFKDAGSGAAVNGQISSTGAVDGYAVGNLKFATGQQDGSGDAGGVNRVAVICDGQRVAQRAGAAVIGICDYDNGSWLGHAPLGSVSLRQRDGDCKDHQN